MKEENAELKRANGILKAAAGLLAAELDRPHLRSPSTCSIAPSANYAHTQRQENRSARQLRDTELKDLIKEIFDADYRVHGARKI